MHFRKIGITIFFILLAAASGYFLLKKAPFLRESVKIDIFAPSQLSAGEHVEYAIVVKNTSNLALKEAVLTFSFPSGFMEELEGNIVPLSPRTLNVGDIPQDGEYRATFQGIAFGTEGEEKKAKASLSYKPEKINVEFTSERDHTFTISFVPLVVTLSFPADVTFGKEFEVRLGYSSSAAVPFPDARIIFEPPQGFAFASAVPLPTQGNSVWDIGNLTRKTSGEIRIRGVLTGSITEKRLFKATLGRYDTAASTFTPYQHRDEEVLVGLPHFTLRHEFTRVKNGVAEPGNVIEGEVVYANESDDTLEGIRISLTFAGEAFDFSSLHFDGGTFDTATKTILWTAETREELSRIEPEGRGELAFSIALLHPIPQASYNDKEFSISFASYADLNGVKLSETRDNIKIATKVVFPQSGLFSGSPLAPSGPIPPKVGVKTTYSVGWQLLNYYNDVRGLKIRAAIPPYVSWEGRLAPQDARISFDSHTGEIVWDVGELPATTGIHMPVKQVYFQVGLIPQAYHVGQTPELVSEALAMGVDTFTGETLEAIANALDSSLPDDPALPPGGGVVTP